MEIAKLLEAGKGARSILQRRAGETQERQDLADTQPATEKEIEANLAKSKPSQPKVQSSKAVQKKAKHAKQSKGKSGKKVNPSEVARDLGKELAAAAAETSQQQSEPKGTKKQETKEFKPSLVAEVVKPCDTKELEALSEEDARLEKLCQLSDQQLAQKVQWCKEHPWFNQYILDVIQPQNQEEWEGVKQFGRVPQVVCEEIWDFENWVMAKEKAGDPKFPEPEPKTDEKAKAHGDSKQQETEAGKPEEKEAEMTTEEKKRAVEANLLRPSTCDLASPPATPVAAPQTLAVLEELAPGEAAAEEERKLREEQRKKRHAQWAKFMRTFESDDKALQDLFQQWLEAGGDWKKSKIYIESCQKEGTTDTDTRGWVTQGELELKMGKAAADSMKKYLEENRPEQCRDHPDAPGVKDAECRQYRVLLKDEEENKKEDFVSKRFSLQEDDSSESSQDAKKAKGSGGEKSKKAPK
eukprot:s58_g43.t1